MKHVKFWGLDTKVSKGCPVCGRRKTVGQRANVRIINLPSGTRKTFVSGKVELVSDSDAKFLVESLRNNDGSPAFEVVYDA